MGNKQKEPNYRIEEVVSIFTRLPRGKVLDLGCGDGDCSLRLKDMGFEVVASDGDANRFHHNGSIEFVPSDLGTALPFQTETFDYVVFTEVIEHLYNPDFVIHEISRVLKASGMLVLSTPNVLNLGSRMRFLFEGSLDFFREPILDYYKVVPQGVANMHVVIWRYQELEYLLFRNRLQVEIVSSDLIKPPLKILGFLLLPLIRFQYWQKERRTRRKGGLDYRRIHKVLLSDALLYGKHLILGARKI